jgi:hypothetical protein
MNQREEVLRAWARHSKNAYRSPQFEKARAFFEMVGQRTDICWEDLVPEVRRNYSDALDEIMAVLMDTNDPLIYNVVHHADMGSSKEVDAVRAFVRNCDAEKHQVTLRAAANAPEMHAELKKKPNLPDTVREALGMKKSKPPVSTKGS